MSNNFSGYSSTGSQQVGGGGYSSANQGGPSSGPSQPTGGYGSSGGHGSTGGYGSTGSGANQHITYSTQTPSGLFYHRPYTTYHQYDDHYRNDTGCTC